MASTGQITPTVSPANATNKAVVYASNNPAVATVNSSGLVTAAAAGTARIKAWPADNSLVFMYCDVTVTNASTQITGLTLTMPNIYDLRYENAEAVVTAHPVPSNAAGYTLAWFVYEDSGALVIDPLTADTATVKNVTGKEHISNAYVRCEVSGNTSIYATVDVYEEASIE
jgi:hypothetical protein